MFRGKTGAVATKKNYFEMCPIKGLHDRNNYIGVVLEGNVTCNSGGFSVEKLVPLTQKKIILKCVQLRAHTTETTTLAWCWKEMLHAIRVSLSKLYVTFFLWCCSQIER